MDLSSKLRSLTLLSATLLLTGCAASIKQAPDFPKEMTEPCKTPQELKTGKHADVESWAIRTATELLTCANRHKSLVDAIERRKALY